MNNYYAIIPAKVRYNKDLTFLEKFLYCELTALSNADGYAFASNKYFADLYDKDQKTISRALSHLEELGFIYMEYEKVGAKVTKRKIWLSEAFGTGDKIVNRTEITGDKKITREQEKFLITSDKIVTDNNVSYEDIIGLILFYNPKPLKDQMKEYNFSENIENAVLEWLRYKKERKEGYGKTATKRLLNKIGKDIKEHGEQYVLDEIDFSITSNYQGLFAPKGNYGRQKTKAEQLLEEKNAEYLRLNGDKLKFTEKDEETF